MLLLLTAISLGFLGSFHCVGMCGPIALALPLDRSDPRLAAAGMLTYNTGRVFTYALLGLLLGLAGKTFVMAGYQRLLTIITGAVLLTIVFIPRQWLAGIHPLGFLHRFVSGRKGVITQLFRRTSPISLFLIGLLNGLLPCGFVYLSLAGAIATGDALKGAAFMAAFGAGTWPAMLAVSFAGHKISMPFRNKIRKAAPFFMGLLAILFIFRGLNLGIPYLSPHLTTVTDTQHACCHK